MLPVLEKPMCPIIAKQHGPQYVQWSFMDMIGLAGRMPDLHGGANKWITALEQNTAGVQLAIGDVKALLMYIAGKYKTEEIFNAAHLPGAIVSHRSDHLSFGAFRNPIWAELRRQYPEKMDPSKLDGETLKDSECPSKFLHTFQQKWRNETGSALNHTQTTKSLK